MREALLKANAYVFDSLGLHRIMANYMPSNERSAHVLDRLGFTREGLAKDYLKIDGRWEDHILTSLINPAG
jgi:ribosomal-protein-alanine N-acetyltransferase